MYQHTCAECPVASKCAIRLSRPPETLNVPEPELRIATIKKKDLETLTHLLQEHVVVTRNGAFKVTDLAGDILFLSGEGALFGPELHFPRVKASVLARPLMPEIELCTMPWPTFQRLMQSRPVLTNEVLTELASVALASRIAFQWTKRSLKDRAILLLGMLRNRFGIRYGQFKMINVPLTKIDIASLMSTVQESAVRVLSELRESGLISQNGKRLIILDNERLDQLIHSIYEASKMSVLHANDEDLVTKDN